MTRSFVFSAVGCLLAVGISGPYLVGCSRVSEGGSGSASNVSRRSEGAISSNEYGCSCLGDDCSCLGDDCSCVGDDCCTGENCPVCEPMSGRSAGIEGRGAFTEQNSFVDDLAGGGDTELSWSSNARDSACAPGCCLARWLCSPVTTDLRNSCLNAHPNGSFSCGAINYNPCYSLGTGFYGVSFWRVCTCTGTVP